MRLGRNCCSSLSLPCQWNQIVGRIDSLTNRQPIHVDTNSAHNLATVRVCSYFLIRPGIRTKADKKAKKAITIRHLMSRSTIHQQCSVRANKQWEILWQSGAVAKLPSAIMFSKHVYSIIVRRYFETQFNQAINWQFYLKSENKAHKALRAS